MSNVHTLPEVSATVAKLHVRPFLKMVDMLYVAGVIECDTQRLAYYCAAMFQQEGEYTTAITRKEACMTWVVVDGAPAAAAVEGDNEAFAKALTMLQAVCGVYSHTSRAKLCRAKDRFTSFACDLRGTAMDPYTKIGDTEVVFIQYRAEMFDTLFKEAQDAIENKLWRAKFAHISTATIEAAM